MCYIAHGWMDRWMDSMLYKPKIFRNFIYFILFYYLCSTFPFSISVVDCVCPGINIAKPKIQANDNTNTKRHFIHRKEKKKKKKCKQNNE